MKAILHKRRSAAAAGMLPAPGQRGAAQAARVNRRRDGNAAGFTIGYRLRGGTP